MNQVNPLHLEAGEDLDLKVAETLSIFQRLFADDGGTSGAPRMETILRHALYTLTQIPGTTLLDIEPLLDRTNESRRAALLGQVHDSESQHFWRETYLAYPKDAHLSLVNRLGRLLQPKIMRTVLCCEGEPLKVRRCMDEGKVLLFNLSDGLLGEQNAQLLGQLIVAKIQLAAMSRASAAQRERRPFYLYIDEFQSFCGASASSYEKILSRARKYGLGLVLAHQQTGQISESMLREILGNVSTIIAFNVGATDARRIALELTGEIDGMPAPTKPDALQGLRVGEAVCRIGRSVFSVTTLPGPTGGSARTRAEVVRRSRQAFGTAGAIRQDARSLQATPVAGDIAGLDPGEVFRA